MRKALLAAVCVSALGLSAPAFAQVAGNIENAGTINGFNDTDQSFNATADLTDTGNDSSDNSVNTDLIVDDVGNNNANNSQNTDIDIDGSGNNNSDNSVNTTLTLDDVGNDNSNTRTSANNHTLTGNVSNAFIVFAAGDGAEQSGDFVSGNARVDTSGSFAGIQNSSANTGLGTNVLVSNALSANADISFGGAD